MRVPNVCAQIRLNGKKLTDNFFTFRDLKQAYYASNTLVSRAWELRDLHGFDTAGLGMWQRLKANIS